LGPNLGITWEELGIKRFHLNLPNSLKEFFKEKMSPINVPKEKGREIKPKSWPLILNCQGPIILVLIIG